MGYDLKLDALNIKLYRFGYMGFKAFYPKTCLPRPQSTSSERRLSVTKSFQTTRPTHNRGESLNIDKVLPGLLLNLISTHLMNSHEHPEALGGYCRGHA